MSTAQAHVLIVEDHPLYRDALSQVLSGVGGRLRCSHAASADQALALLARLDDVDLVVSDYRLQQDNGLTLLDTVGRRWPTVVRVLMSGSEDAGLAERARQQGLAGFLPKTLEPRRMAEAIDTVLAGELWFPEPPAGQGSDADGLTAQQLRVLAAVAGGQANKAVARGLGLSERTVKYHLEEAYRRLDASNRAEAVATALARGLITLPR